MDLNLIRNLLELASKQDATDIHLVADRPPIFRIHGELAPSSLPSLSADEVKAVVFNMLTDRQREIFKDTKEIDFSYFGLKDFQFRVNAHVEKGNVAATFRITPTKIKTAEELALPPVIKELALKRKGLIIFSGTAGSGKTTTLSYMVDVMNTHRRSKIVTIEDPIEYIHQSKKSLIIQREVGSDTQSFTSALKYALRQDPDVVMIGEMRDLESISMALTTAETGHLVLTTVHAPDAVETINRIIDVYPAANREQIYVQLAENLLAVISQTLVPRQDMPGRILATEILISTMAVRNMIRRGALVEIRGQLDAEKGSGMHSLEKCLSELAIKKLISEKTAKEFAKFPDMLKFSDDDAIAPRRKEKEPPPETGPSSPKRAEKILIVEHEEQDRERMAMAIKKQGYEQIFCCAKAREALDNVKSLKPDIIVLDMGFYDVDVFAICKQMKAASEDKAKVILITGNLRSTDAAHAKEAGVDGFVVKNASFDLLIKSIEKLNPVVPSPAS